MSSQNDEGFATSPHSSLNVTHKSNTRGSLAHIGKSITLTAQALVSTSDLHSTILSSNSPYTKVMSSTLKQTKKKNLFPNNVNIDKNIDSVNSQGITQPSSKYFKNNLISERKTFQLLSHINDRLLHDLHYNDKNIIRHKQLITDMNHNQQTDNDTRVPSLYQGFQTLSFSNVGNNNRKLLIDNKSRIDSMEKSESINFLKELESKMKDELSKCEIKKNITISELDDIDRKIEILKFRRNLLFNNIANIEEKEINIGHDLSLIKSRMANLPNINDLFNLEKDNDTSHNDTTVDTLLDYNSSVTSSTTVSYNRASAFGNSSTNESPSCIDFVTTTNNNNNNNNIKGFADYSDIHSPDNLLRFFQEKNKINNKISPTLQQYFNPGSEISSFTNIHHSSVSSFQFDLPFGHLYSSSYENPEIKIWDLSKDIQIGNLVGHKDTVYCMELDKSYNMLISGSKDSTLKMWDLNKSVHTFNNDSVSDGNICVYSFDEHVDSVTNISINSHFMVSGSQDSTIRQWDLYSGRCIQILDLMSNDTINLFNQSSNTSVNNPTRINTVNNNEVPKIGGLQSYDVALATGTSDGIVRLWDLRSGDIVRSLVGHSDSISCLKFDLQNILTGSLDQTVRVWDLRVGSTVQVLEYSSPIISLDFDSKNIVVSDGSSQIHIFDRMNLKNWVCGDKESLNSNISFIQYTENYLVGSLLNGSIHAWAI